MPMQAAVYDRLSSAAGTAAAMLRFLIFTACRTNEVVGARWSEIDRPLSAWRIPGDAHEDGPGPHVPLSDPALAILDEMRNGSQGELIFPNPDGGQFSENAMLAVLDRLGYGHVTVHGFRSTFRDMGGGMHRLSRWRPRGSPSTQIQIARRRPPISVARS